MVADVHRTLVYGGIFLYPANVKSPKGKVSDRNQLRSFITSANKIHSLFHTCIFPSSHSYFCLSSLSWDCCMNATPWPTSWSRQEAWPPRDPWTSWTSSPPASTSESPSSWDRPMTCRSILPSVKSIKNEVFKFFFLCINLTQGCIRHALINKLSGIIHNSTFFQPTAGLTAQSRGSIKTFIVSCFPLTPSAALMKEPGTSLGLRSLPHTMLMPSCRCKRYL